MSRQIVVDQNRMYAAGWREPRVDRLKFVNHTIIENAYKVRKKSFVFYVAVICTATGGTEQKRACMCRVPL